jgi:hypothetical protein
MPVVIDNENVPADQLGLHTFGQVLAHLQKSNRLIVHVLIDGEEPDLERLSTLRHAPTHGHTIFVETAEPAQMARDVLDAIGQQLNEADTLCREAGSLVQSGQHTQAFEKLTGCFGRWQNVQESVQKVSQLLRLDLERVTLDDGRPLRVLAQGFGEQLRGLRDALETRDFVALGDALCYELPEWTAAWRSAMLAVRAVVPR